MRDGLRAMLANSPWEVIGEADNGKEALRALQECETPDLVLVDLSMPKMPGTRFVELYRQTTRTTRILVLTAYAEEEYVHRALQAGADGYALKDSSMEELRHAIGVVLDGYGYLSPQVCSGVIRGYLHGGRDTSDISLLTPRERDVLHLATEGMQNARIAEELVISVKTVEKHKANLLRKLGMSSTTELRNYIQSKDLRL